MFMVLSSWQSNCESSPGSFDEHRTAPRLLHCFRECGIASVQQTEAQ